MTTIPTKDGAPDWGKLVLDDDCLTAERAIKAAYIAALEWCAKWHEEQADRYSYASDRKMAHALSASKIQKWIEREKANG